MCREYLSGPRQAQFLGSAIARGALDSRVQHRHLRGGERVGDGHETAFRKLAHVHILPDAVAGTLSSLGGLSSYCSAADCIARRA